MIKEIFKSKRIIFNIKESKTFSILLDGKNQYVQITEIPKGDNPEYDESLNTELLRYARLTGNFYSYKTDDATYLFTELALDYLKKNPNLNLIEDYLIRWEKGVNYSICSNQFLPTLSVSKKVAEDLIKQTTIDE